MKVPITDQFLYDVYDLFEKTSDVAHIVFRRRRTMKDVLPENPIMRKYNKVISKQQFRKLIYYLKRKNWIKVENLKGKKAILLTKNGVDKAIKARFKIESQQRQKRKDKKWIMVIFDIPQNHWHSRTLFKSILINLGYKKFQQSVWVSPYDVSEKTEQLLQFHSLDH